MKRFIFIILHISLLYAAPVTIKDQLLHAHKGDYIITEKNKLYTALVINHICSDYVIIEEISTPYKQTDWKKWLEKEKAHYSSWSLFYIDLQNNALIDIYFPLSNQHFLPQKSLSFIHTLLQLPLLSISPDQCKKIGPPPLNDAIDRRPLWIPPKIVEGAKEKFRSLNIRRIQWPQDGSDLQGKSLDLYFDQNCVFPFWGQLHTDHLQIILKAIDSGTTQKNRPDFFVLSPHIIQQETTRDHLILTIQTYPNHDQIILHAINRQGIKKILSPSFSIEKKGTKLQVIIPSSEIRNNFTLHQKYKWIVSNSKMPHITSESEVLFLEKFLK